MGKGNRVKGKTATVRPVILEEGRWTVQRQGETVREAEARLMEGEDLDTPGLPANIKRIFDSFNGTRGNE